LKSLAAVETFLVLQRLAWDALQLQDVQLYCGERRRA
jgi:hypothetical protein